MPNRASKGRYGDSNDPKVIARERARIEADEEFKEVLPEFMSRPEAFNDPDKKKRRMQTSALPFRLSPMQYKFAYEFLETGDAHQAYINAGYSVKGKKPFQIRGRAKDLLKTPKVSAFVDYIREKAVDKLALSVEDIVNKFLTTYDTAMQEGDLTNANRALENLGKHLGMFVERSMVEQKITMSQDQIDAELAKYQGVIDAAVNKHTGTDRTQH